MCEEASAPFEDANDNFFFPLPHLKPTVGECFIFMHTFVGSYFDFRGINFSVQEGYGSEVKSSF